MAALEGPVAEATQPKAVACLVDTLRLALDAPMAARQKARRRAELLAH
jgi:hypothetical protein